MPIVVSKTIKPSRLREDKLRLELLSAVRKVGRQIKKDFEKTVETWDKKPDFEMVVSLKGGPSVLVGTDNEIYRYLNDGTGIHGPSGEPYPIKAGILTGKSDKRALAFRSGYVAKTAPRVLGSRAGGAFGDKVLALQVMHPGVEGREWEQVITEKWKSQFKRDMEAAMRRVAAESGHGF